MSTREKVAEAIYMAAPYPPLQAWSEMPDKYRERALRCADAAIAAHLEALKADGYAVVKLPDADGIKRQHISFGPDAECEHECCPAWIEDDDTEISYSLDEARELAAALLSAADAAEASR